MKHYNTKFIKEYIEEHKEEIESVSCGMREDWSWTVDMVFAKGKFLEDYNWQSDYICVYGIDGSIWATPVMEVTFKNGGRDIIECFADDGDVADERKVRACKSFAAATGGMDFKF